MRGQALDLRDRQVLTTLQAGRAIAALAVVMTHANVALEAFGQRLPVFLAVPSSRGYLGVDFFFVLSGFIIAYAHGRDPPGHVAAASYLAKRALRIYVPYLPVAAALIALYLLLPAMSQANRNWGWATSLFLIPSDQPPALSVAWTLVHEVAFYAVFLVFFFTRWFGGIAAAWAGAIVMMRVAGYDPGERNTWAAAFLAPINLEFIAGMGAAWLAARLDGRWGVPAAAVGAAAAVIVVAVDAHRVFFGLSMAPLVLGLVLIEGQGRLRAPGWLVFLGAASYAIYLVHNPLISLVVRLTQRFGAWEVGLLACVVTAVTLGCTYHVFVEKPALRAARRLIAGREAAPKYASGR